MVAASCCSVSASISDEIAVGISAVVVITAVSISMDVALVSRNWSNKSESFRFVASNRGVDSRFVFY